jgi:hypothetical protein
VPACRMGMGFGAVVSSRCTLIVVDQKVLKRYRCRSPPQLLEDGYQEHQMTELGTVMRFAAAGEHHNHRSAGCKCLRGVLRAYGHSSERQLQVWSADQATCLRCVSMSLAQNCTRSPTVLAHRLSISPCQLRSQFSNALIQLLNLRFTQNSTWRLMR